MEVNSCHILSLTYLKCGSKGLIKNENPNIRGTGGWRVKANVQTTFTQRSTQMGHVTGCSVMQTRSPTNVGAGRNVRLYSLNVHELIVTLSWTHYTTQVWWNIMLFSHLSVIYVPLSVIRPQASVVRFRQLLFTPIRLFQSCGDRFLCTDSFKRYSPGKWLTEGFFVGNSLSTAHYHDLWSASVIRRPLKSLPYRSWLTLDDGRRMTD